MKKSFFNLSSATVFSSRTGILKRNCSKMHPFIDPKTRTENSGEEFWWSSSGFFFFFCRLNLIYPGSWKLQVILMERPQPLETVCLAHTTCWSMVSGKVFCIPVDTYMINILLSSFSGAERCYLSALIYVLNYRYTWSNKVKTRIRPHKNLAYSVYQKTSVVPRKAKGCAITQQRLKFLTKTGTSLKIV